MLGSAVEWSGHVQSAHAVELAEAKQKDGRACIKVEIPNGSCPFCEWEMKDPDKYDQAQRRQPGLRRGWLPSFRVVLKIQSSDGRGPIV